MTDETRNLPSSLTANDGHAIAIRQWLPDEQPKTVVLVLHGLAEHSARYERFALAATARGVAVVTYDHRGHGPAEAASSTAHFADRGGWEAVVADVGHAIHAIRETFANTPVVLLGHSMGSYIAQSFAMRAPETINRLVLSGSTWPNRGEVRVARSIAWVISTFAGAASPARLITKLSFGKFNDAFKPNRTEFDWLSRDPDEVDKYVADPHCGQLASNRLWFDLLGGLLEISEPGAHAKLPKELPVLILGGERDPAGGTRALTALQAAYLGAGLGEVALELYPGGRHEMLNEINRNDVTADILDWIGAR